MIVQIASIPEREESLKRTVDSIIDQVDHVYLSLNNYTESPFNDPKITAVLLDNSRRDCAKFLDIEKRQGYILLLDDDIQVPRTYCADFRCSIDRYKCVCTLHGKNFKRPFQSFIHLKDNYRCLGNVLKDAQVEVGGTGVMGWHSDFLKVKYSDFNEPGMADICMAKACKERGVKIMVLAHTENYLKYTRFGNTLFTAEIKKGFKRQDEILRQMYGTE